MKRLNVAEIMHYDVASQPAGRTTVAAGYADVADLWRILSSRRRLVLATLLLCFLGALIYVLVTRSEFTASAQILIDPRDRQIVSKDVTPDTLAADGGILQVESQSKLIESDAVLLRAVRTMNLADDEDYGAPKDGLFATLMSIVMGGDRGTSLADNEARALRVLRRHLAIKRADKVFVVDIVVTAYSGPKAAKIADAIAEAYLADQIQSRSDSTKRASDALVARLSELRRAVETSADAVERFKSSHDLLGTDKQLISDQQLNDNGTQLNSAQAKVAELSARVSQLDVLRRSRGDGSAIPEAIQSSVITQLRASQSDLIRRRSDMRTRFGDRHPDLIAIDAEIKQSQMLIDTELDRLMRSAHADLDRAKKNERALAGNQDALKRQTVSNNQAFVTLQELVRELDARRSVYQAFLSRAAETKEQSSIDSTNARIISRAIPPIQPSWPLRAIILLGAIGGGLGFGAAVAFIAEYGAPTILSPGQLAAVSGTPVLGVLARRPRHVFSAFRTRGTKRDAATSAGGALRLAVSRLFGPLGSLRDKPNAQTLLLLSAGPAPSGPEGFGVALGRAAAEGDASVLIVDIGSDGPSDARADGFLNVLGGRCSLKSVVARDVVPGVFRLGPGRRTAGTSGVLTSESMQAFVSMAGRKLDLILFTTTSGIDDARVASLAALVDDVVLVVVRGETLQKDVIALSDLLATCSGRPPSGSLLVDRPEHV